MLLIAIATAELLPVKWVGGMWPPFRLGVVGVAPLTAHILVFYFPALKKFKGKFTSAGKFKGENKPRKVKRKMREGAVWLFSPQFPPQEGRGKCPIFHNIWGGKCGQNRMYHTYRRLHHTHNQMAYICTCIHTLGARKRSHLKYVCLDIYFCTYFCMVI